MEGSAEARRQFTFAIQSETAKSREGLWEKSESCAPFPMSYERGDFTFPRPPVVLPSPWPMSASTWKFGGWTGSSWDGRAGPGGPEGGLRLGPPVHQR